MKIVIKKQYKPSLTLREVAILALKELKKYNVRQHKRKKDA